MEENSKISADSSLLESNNEETTFLKVWDSNRIMVTTNQACSLRVPTFNKKKCQIWLVD